MKTISAALEAHLRQEVTTLCTCWKIVRQDGQVFGFTDHDQDIVFNGLTYESETGYNRSAIASDASLSVDNLDVTGFLESDRISENDLRNGLFDFANVYIFALNWADVSQAEIKLRRGWFGEVVLNQNGSFETEIRGLHQALSYNFMESYQPECRADFCDSRCTLVYANYVRPVAVLIPNSRSQFVVSAGVVDPDAVGAHSYWRIQPVVVPNYQYVGLAELALFGQDGAVLPGGSVSAQSEYNINYAASKARDGSVGTYWCSKAGQQASWFQVHYETPVDVKSLSITTPDIYSYAPTQFTVQYSDDGVNFTDVATIDATWTAGKQQQTFIFNEGNVWQAPPEPAAGAVTYVGGTVKFTTGENTGKTIEIIAYDKATGLVTVLENFPFEVSIGDGIELAQGCDKRFETCKLYQNQKNFRGEPHVPGQDEYLKYPDAHDE